MRLSQKEQKALEEFVCYPGIVLALSLGCQLTARTRKEIQWNEFVIYASCFKKTNKQNVTRKLFSFEIDQGVQYKQD